jgi:hypothetical protein
VRANDPDDEVIRVSCQAWLTLLRR